MTRNREGTRGEHCKSKAVNEFPVCLWNERGDCSEHLCPSKYLSKARHKEVIICHSTLISPSPPPPHDWKKTKFKPMQWQSPKRPTELRYIFSSLWCCWFLSQQYKLCHCVLPCRLHWPPTWCVWPFLSPSSFASLCSTSAPAALLASGRPCPLVRPVTLRTCGTYFGKKPAFCRCLSDLLLVCWDAAAGEDDVKAQLEKLWQEVNSLKEMQALQTGTALTHCEETV